MEVIRSAPDGSGNIVTSIFKGLDGDKELMLNILCASNVKAGSPTITPQTFRTIAVCKRVDSSNFCVQLPAAPPPQIGSVIEVYPEGGSITIFPDYGTFFDGSSSLSTSDAVQFRYIVNADSSVGAWAKIG